MPGNAECTLKQVIVLDWGEAHCDRSARWAVADLKEG